MTSTHGLVQDQVLTAAAQKLSEAKVALADALADAAFYDDYTHRELALAADVHRQDAQEDYDAAFKVYTNPFGVNKHVDVRWPAVGATEEYARMTA